MTVLIRLLFVACSFESAFAVASDDYNRIFEQAVDEIDFDFDESWAFSETQIDSEHVWVGRFDQFPEFTGSWQHATRSTIRRQTLE